MNAAEIVWRAAGAPVIPGCQPTPDARCWVCAGPAERSMPRVKWMGALFTGQNRVRMAASSVVCESCVFVCAGRPPDTMRMHSHLWCAATGWRRLTKADKPEIRDFILGAHEGPWFAAIADSGKKHLLPWTPINHAGSRSVYFEERNIALPSDAAELIGDLTKLLTAGASKADIARGEYSPYAWRDCAAEIRRFESRWSGARHGSWFELALWLSQREDADG